MRFDPQLAAVRFGTGLSKNYTPPSSVDGWMASVDGDIETAWPFVRLETLKPMFKDAQRLRKLRSQMRGNGATEAERKQVGDDLKAIDRKLHDGRLQTLHHSLARGAFDRTGFSTRLSVFWTDHFSVSGNQRLWRDLHGDYIDGAIRPHILGRFEDMMMAVLTHPLMLHYLDQISSIGPNSVKGQQSKGRGVNENLAREALELHSLGVDGSYTQDDVQAFANLLTGLTGSVFAGFRWRPKVAEPGPHLIMGQAYGSKSPQLSDIQQAVSDIAKHPDTARHLATKMARHFVTDTPTSDLVQAMVDGYGPSGDLAAMTEAMLAHPDAWGPQIGNVKWAFEYVVSVMRAMGMQPNRLTGLNRRKSRDLFQRPLAKMGQPFLDPSGPDGLAESDALLMQPTALAARLDWALKAPDLMVRGLPDPRQILPHVLPGKIPEAVQQAVNSATSRHEGLAMIFVSPAFQRR